MNFVNILILAIVQGVAELLPVSSSAHVIMAEKLLGLDPTSPQMTFLLVMLHTGTMFAVIAYFWKSWQARFFSSKAAFVETLKVVVVATVATGIVGLALMFFIEKVVLRGSEHAEIEHLFGNTTIIAGGLAAAGVLILVSGLRKAPSGPLTVGRSAWIGAVQGLCLPFRGFSRSGATISTGLLLGVEKIRSEEFSFALAVVLTPAVIVKEGHRLLKDQAQAPGGLHDLASQLGPALLGMLLSFAAGWVALRWLSKWLEQGRWYLFAPYCFAASAFVVMFGR
jgi:undecaprenyl-diphosphatase